MSAPARVSYNISQAFKKLLKSEDMKKKEDVWEAAIQVAASICLVAEIPAQDALLMLSRKLGEHDRSK